MRAVQVLFHLDPARRTPEALLLGWRSLTGSAAAAARLGIEVHVALPADRNATIERDGAVYHFVQADRARRGRGGRPAPIGRRALRRLASLIRDLDADLLHIHGLSLPRYAAALRWATGVGAVLAQDHADRVPGPLRRRAARRGACSYDGVLFTHREQAEPFFRAGALPEGLAVHEVLESSADFAPGDVAAARVATGLHGDPCLLWVGNLTPNKDPLTVLEGLARAAPRLRDPHLWCCFREAPLLQRLEQRIGRDPWLAGRVHLLGARPHAEVETLLRAADLLVQGSHREGSGYAVIEALACGTMPVVTSIPSFRRIVGDAGELWAPSDPAGLADALVAAASREPASRRRRARDRFERGLSWDAVGLELADAYRSAVGLAVADRVEAAGA